METIVQLDQLQGYNHELESARHARFDEFMTANDIEQKRKAFDGLAELTAMRSPIFIASYERALGLREVA